MMSDLRKAAEQAVAHLTNLQPKLANGLLNKRQLEFIDPYVDLALEALRATLAEPAVEPASNGKLFHAKFNVGEHVWYMKDNKPTEVVISAIEVFFVNTNQDRITYNAKNVTNSVSWLDHTNLQESWLFRSKAELLESL